MAQTMSKILYLTDLDGTLLHSGAGISEYTVDIVNRLINAGECFSYATARSLVSASKITAQLDLQHPVICYNGGFIIDPNSREIISAQYFDKDDVGYIVNVLEENGVYLVVYAYIDGVERVSYVNCRVNSGIQHYLDSRRGDVRLREAKSLDEFYYGDIFYFLCIGDEEQMKVISEIFKADGRMNCIFHKELYTDDWWCELMPIKADKGLAAIKLKEMLGAAKLVVFGDAVNDLPMFAVADESYAMADAVPELKAAASAVIDSNNEDGVACWLAENAIESNKIDK